MVVLSCIFMSACASSIEKPEIDKMEAACKDHGGIYKISTLGIKVKCADGTWFHSDGTEWK